ncbi:MAG: ribbon-helix-helix protein, CopG family [Deltaproteobacteria bacterium]|nr:ribbon-helix-helix protein, CopG family [Deltaproteobacteria bacterium]
MRVVQITLEPELLSAVDRTAKQHRTTRSALVREALRRFIVELRTRAREAADREGYRRAPVRPGEFDVFDGVAAWPPK